jgi:simple sugar transport system substrate-binding protein
MVFRKKHKFYLVSHGGTQDPFWKPVKEGMEDAARLLNVDAHYKEPKDRLFISSDEELVENLEKSISEKPDGIAVTITTKPEILDESLQKAERKGIPVIAINVPDFRNDKKKLYKAYIGMDEYGCGKLLAEIVVKKFIPKHAVVGIHQEGHKGLKQRAMGIRDVLSEKSVETSCIYISNSPVFAIKKLEEYFEETKDIDCIFMLGPLGTIPALKFLEDKNLFGKVKVATVDLTNETIKAIKEDKIICTATQWPYIQGFWSILWLWQYKKGMKPPEEDIYLGPTLVTKDNIDPIISVEKFIKAVINTPVIWKRGISININSIFNGHIINIGVVKGGGQTEVP